MGYKHLPVLEPPTDPIELGYIAGIIDGEGCIGMGVTFTRHKSKRQTHSVRLAIVNTDPRLAQWFCGRFGGTVHRQDPPANKRWKPKYTWQCGGARAETLIAAIEPFLVLKREQAQIVLAMRAIGRHRGGGTGKGPRPLTDEVVEKREELKQRLHLLNARGTAEGVA